MVERSTVVDSFSAFVKETGPGLKHALMAALGPEIGSEAAAEALTYGWEHWDRVEEMDNPGGYLFRVGRNWGKPYRAATNGRRAGVRSRLVVRTSSGTLGCLARRGSQACREGAGRPA